jgi:lysozyme
MGFSNHFQLHGGKYTTAGAWLGICIACTSGYEGYASHPYVDKVGTGHPVTWCYGETEADAPIPSMSATFTKEQCQQQLGTSLVKYDAQIQKCIDPKVYAALPPHRHAALVSLDYNIGPGNFCKSNVVRNLNAGKTQAACDAFLSWTHASGRVVQGLVNRRQSERKLCLMED